MTLSADVRIPLSFSNIKLFEQCPHRYYQSSVLKKFPYVQSEAAARGDRIHQEFENYIKSGEPLSEAKPFSTWVEAFAEQDGIKHTEFKMAIDWKSKKVGYYKGRDIWVRGQFDLMVEQGNQAVLIDYKTGKSKYADTGQLELMSYLSFIHFPKIDRITAGLVFIDETKVIQDVYTRDKMDTYRDRWMARSIPIVTALTTRKFPMKESPLCAYCPCVDCPNYRGD